MPLFSDGFFPPAWSVLPLVSFGIINNSSQVFYNFPRFWFAKEVVRFTELCRLPSRFRVGQEGV